MTVDLNIKTQNWTQVFLASWAILLSITWLLPYHFEPWSSFYSDAWMGIMVGIATTVVLLRTRNTYLWTTAPCIVVMAILIPWIQYFAGLIPFFGEAWITSLYLTGLLSAVILGSHWERSNPDEIFFALAAALLIAGTCSVWLQLGHWLNIFQVNLTDTWTMGFTGERPYANVGQPNLLATLLVWSLLACLWMHARGIFTLWTVLAIGAFLLLGLALTQSRTGALELFAVLTIAFARRRLWTKPNLHWVLIFLTVVYISYLFVLPQLREALLLGEDTSFERYRQFQDRLLAWRIFAEAVLERPTWGYGWMQLRHVQMVVADHTSPLGVLFSSSHNIVLDLFLWLGLPLGGTITILSTLWIWKRFSTINRAQDLIAMMLILTAVLHGMLEYPLQYAYFLLPVGIVIGVLDARYKAAPVLPVGRSFMLIMLLAGAVCIATTLRDYIRVEQDYLALRLERAKLLKNLQNPIKPSDLWVLTQFEEWFRFARFSSHTGMTAEQIEWLETISLYYPTPSALYRMAVTLAINGRAEETAVWLKRLCASTNADSCTQYRSAWEREAQSNPEVARIAWPS